MRERDSESMLTKDELDEAPPPSLLAYALSYLVIGLAALALAKFLFKREAKVGLMAAALAAAIHHRFDAPLARKLMSWNWIADRL
jgi:hypothetical protein